MLYCDADSKKIAIFKPKRVRNRDLLGLGFMKAGMMCLLFLARIFWITELDMNSMFGIGDYDEACRAL